jgi:undecaprenyl-diphosphatase
MKSFHSFVKNLLFLLVYICSGLALTIIIDGLITGTELSPFNTAVEAFVSHLRTPWLTEVMLFITNIGSPYALSIVAFVLIVVLLLHRETYEALLYIVSLTLTVVSFVVLKNFFQFSRPADSLVSLSTWSFPSGHATVATAFFFTTAYSFFDWTKSFGKRAMLVFVCILATCLISFSRIYLGAHFALDVLAGTALGLMSVSLTALLFNVFLEEKRLIRRKRSL